MTKLIPANELDRLAALASYDILETANEAVFNDLANLAARVAGTGFAAVTLSRCRAHLVQGGQRGRAGVDAARGLVLRAHHHDARTAVGRR